MQIEQINSQEAQAILEKEKDAVYLDVRSVQEFVRGHPEKAINIPLMHSNEPLPGMTANPNFLEVVLKNIPKERTIIVGCQVGGRSQRACEILENHGYHHLYNVQGGFGGMAGVPGWKDFNLPVSQENGEGVSYESLLKINK